MSMSIKLLMIAVVIAADIMLLMVPVLAAMVIAPILLMAALDCISITCQKPASANCHKNRLMNRRVSP